MLKTEKEKRFSLSDIMTIWVSLFYAVISFLFSDKLSNWNSLILVDLIVILIVLALALPKRFQKTKTLKLFRQLYFLVVVYLLYLQTTLFLVVFRTNTIDELLIKIDWLMFGTNPTETLAKIATPILTEYLQITYSFFYFIPISHLLELFFWSSYKNCRKFTSSIVLTYYLLFLLYFLLPAIGPRYTIHDESTINKELPGLWLTIPFRNTIDNSDSVLNKNPVYKNIPNRDCMPSGHTMFTLMTIISAFYLRTKLRWILLIWGSSVIVATVYLRYHYVIDILAGAIIALIIMGLLLYEEKLNSTGNSLYKRFSNLKTPGLKPVKKF